MQRISITNPQNIIDGTAKKYYFKLRNTGGPKGDKGDKGDTGSRGPQGEPGDPCTVVVNSTATLEPGSNAYVTNTGSLSNAVLNFGIPQGPRGPQGVKGDPGEPGQKGEPGPRGIQGERGTNATVSIGTTSTLNPGSQATVYNSGSDSNAVLNFGIPQGAKGDTGSQGPQGPTGPAGQNFTPTIVAELPATGDESKLYLTPKAHTTQTATGNPITATVAEEAGAIESFQLDGDTFQQSYTGKNLFDIATASNVWIDEAGISLPNPIWTNSDFIKVEPNTTYALSGSTIEGGFKQFQYHEYSSNDESSYINQYAQINWENSITFTTHTGCNFIRVGYRNDSLKDIQLEAGSTATSYEPYVGGQPSPNPDYPQPIQTVTGRQVVKVEGKNLYDGGISATNQRLSTSTGGGYSVQGWGISSYVSVQPNTTYTINTQDRIFCDEYAIDKTFIKGTAQTYGVTDPITITTTSTTRFIRFDFPKGNNTVSQLEKGSTATAYEPYSSNDYEINLGKNLFDGTIYKTDYILSSNGVETPVIDAVITSSIKVQPNTTYTVSANIQSGYDKYMRVGIYQGDMTFISRPSSPVQDGKLTFTTPANAQYVRLSYFVPATDVQLEVGSTASDFAPYFTPIELCKIGDYQDYIYKDGDDWKVHKEVGKVTLDSTFYNSRYGTNNYGLTQFLVELGASDYYDTTNYVNMLSSSFIKQTTSFSNTQVQGFLPALDSNFHKLRAWIRISTTTADTTDQFKAWLNTNTPIFYYKLNTATDTTITDTTLIAQLEAIRTASLQNGTNTITNSATGSNLAGDMEIGYYGYNPTNRYDKFIWLDLNNNYEQIGE